MSKPLAQIVNDRDEVIGHKDRHDINYQKEIYRVAALWITNSKGDVLLAQRALSKRLDPGRWGPAVAGTIEDDETYEQNIYKEAEEEIGLTRMKFKKGPKLRIHRPRNLFVQFYKVTLDRSINSFKLLKEEVADLKWFPRDELLEELKTRPNKFTYAVEDFLKIAK